MDYKIDVIIHIIWIRKMKILFDETYASNDGKQASRNIWCGDASDSKNYNEHPDDLISIPDGLAAA